MKQEKKVGMEKRGVTVVIFVEGKEEEEEGIWGSSVTQTQGERQILNASEGHLFLREGD